MDRIHKRNANREAILRALHFEGPLRRGALSARLGIRKSSVTSLTAELLDAGILDETRPGTPRSPLRLRPDGAHVAVAHLEPGHIRLGRVGLDGAIRDTRSISLLNTTPTRTLPRLASELARLLADPPGLALGLGVALPGIVDPDTGHVVFSSSLGGWQDVPLAAELSRRLGQPVRIDNDVRCQLWAGAWFRRLLRDAANLFYVGVLDGVACALILHGRRVVGGRHAAGEVGHVRAGGTGRRCSCGKTDCLETYCSLPALLEDARRARRGARIESADDLARLAASEPAVRRVLESAAQRLARVLAPVLAAVDPDVVVLGSGSRALAEALTPPLDRALRDELVGQAPRQPLIRIGDPDKTSTLQGIAGLVLESAFGSGEFAASRRGAPNSRP